MTPEGKVKAEIVDYLKTMRPDIWYYCAQDRFTAGIPDIICCYRGRFIGIEVKRIEYNKDMRRYNRLQEVIGEKIVEAGGDHCIATSIENVKQFFFDSEVL